MTYHSNMTSKGQVTVPKDIREALGLAPGSVVGFEIDDDGNARILKIQAETKAAAARVRLARASSIFKANDRFPGMTTDDFMAMVREPLHDFEHDDRG